MCIGLGRSYIMRKKSFFKITVAIGFIALLATCGLFGDIDELHKKAVEELLHKLTIEVSVSPSSVTITRGQTQQFTATVRL